LWRNRPNGHGPGACGRMVVSDRVIVPARRERPRRPRCRGCGNLSFASRHRQRSAPRLPDARGFVASSFGRHRGACKRDGSGSRLGARRARYSCIWSE
jgi:hypothetical protein